MKRITVKCSDVMHRELKLAAVKADLSLNQVFIDAARLWLASQQPDEKGEPDRPR